MSCRRGSDPYCRASFTLVELLIVLAIVAVLLGLLLGAVQRVRASAARADCGNRLRQLGLALHHYHDTHRSLPPGCSYGTNPDATPHMSWMTRLLPMLEQDALWREALAAYSQSKFFEDPPHRPVLGHVLPAFTCPADGRTSQPADFGAFQVGLTSYLGVEGTNQDEHDGVLYLNSQVRLGDIRDGTSNTLMVGERPSSPHLDFGWWYAGWGQMKTGSCDSVLGVHEINTSPFLDTICRPGASTFGPGALNNTCDMFHFWSLHPGGANFLFADGSVRFLAYSAAPVLPVLATRAGGEVAELPN